MDALDLSTRAISAANHRYRRRTNDRVSVWRAARSGVEIGGSPTSHDPYRSTHRRPRSGGRVEDTPRGGLRAAARARETRRDETRRETAARGGRARDGDGVGRRTPDAGDASVR